MRVLELAPQIYVSGQLFEHDVRLMAKQGVRSIMNNRPDGESDVPASAYQSQSNHKTRRRGIRESL